MKRPRLNVSVQDIQNELKDLSYISAESELRKIRRYKGYLPGRNQQHIVSRGKSKYKGVQYINRKSCKNKPWRSRLWAKNTSISLGSFKTEKEAAKAYDKAAKAIYGELAILNFPDE